MNARLPHPKNLMILPAIMALATSPAAAQMFGGGCGTFIRPEEVAQALQQQQAGMYVPPANTSAYRFVRVKVHIVRMSDGTGGIDMWNVYYALTNINLLLAPDARIYLTPQGDVDYIDDDNFYANIGSRAQIDALRAVRPQAKMLNIYFTEHLADENGDLSGVSSSTFSSPQGIVMSNQCVFDTRFSHQVGHYFDLFHTHESAFGSECVNGSNCATAGDLVCDTPADPCLDFGNQLIVVNQNCQYVGPFTDACSGAHFAPDTGNIMSFAPLACMNHITLGQSRRALATLVNLRRSHLIASADVGNAIYLDTSAPPPASYPGLWPSPFNSFGAALAATPTGGVLAIVRAAANEGPVTLNRRMVIYNSGPENTVIRLGTP